MARIRSIHPSLFTDEAYMELSMSARVLLPGVWTECDDQGVFAWKPLTLKARLMPADNVDIVALMFELMRGNFVKKFTFEDKDYGAVRNFRKYQRPKKPTATHPLPDELRTYVALPKQSGELVTHPGGTIDDNEDEDAATGTEKSPQMEDGGGRVEDGGDSSLRSPSARAPEILSNPKPLTQQGGTCGEPVTNRPPEVAKPISPGVIEIPEHLRRYPDEFDRFVAAYPSTGEGKVETFDAWKATKKSRPLADDLLRAVAGYVTSLANENRIRPPNNQRQPCHASRWLNEHRWERYEAPIAEVKSELTAEERMLGRRRAWGGHPAVEILCAELGEGVYDTWFAVCRLEYVDGLARLRAPTRLVRDFLATKHMDRLERAFGPMVMILLAGEEVAAASDAAQTVAA